MSNDSPFTDVAEDQLQSPVGLVAGNGSFPIEFARSAKERGLGVVVAAHLGETDPAIESLVDKCVWLKVGQLGKIIDCFKRNGVKQAAFAPWPRFAVLRMILC